MSHVIYRSEGVVLGGTAFGEANRYVTIFTRDFGMISVRVQGVRMVQSKFRAHLEDYAISQIGFVRGREALRLTNALKMCNIDAILADKPHSRRLSIQILALLKRLAPPDEPHPLLYDELRSLFDCLLEKSISERDLRTIEYIIVARMLHTFGYFSPDVPFTELFTKEPMSPGTLAFARGIGEEIRNEINKSLRLTHL